MDADGVGLIADVGRVSVRFGLTGGRLGSGVHAVGESPMAEHATFTDALLAYLAGQQLANARMRSVFAIAGAARGDVINLTGSRWFVSLSGIQAVLGERPVAINECAASALALPALGAAEYKHLAGGLLRPFAPSGSYLIVSPRTGLGFAGLVGDGSRWTAVQSEAGHTRFVAETPDEAKVAEAIRRRGGTATIEAVLSATGLATVYAALGGAAASSAEEVVRAASRDRVAAEALRLYSGALGAAIADVVLTMGAWDGVFLNGGFARQLAPRLTLSALSERLQGKGAFRRQLSQVPLAVVMADDLELKGAAAALARAA